MKKTLLITFLTLILIISVLYNLVQNYKIKTRIKRIEALELADKETRRIGSDIICNLKFSEELINSLSKKNYKVDHDTIYNYLIINKENEIDDFFGMCIVYDSLNNIIDFNRYKP
jgi:hypothetical protein